MRLLHMTFPYRNRRAVKAGYKDQADKVSEEFGEAMAAFRGWFNGVDTDAHLCEELLDLMLAAEALFCKMPEDAQQRAVLKVIEKGEERSDWVE